MKRLLILITLTLTAGICLGEGTNILPEKVPLTINYTNYNIVFPTGTTQIARFLSTNDIATVTALNAKPSGMVNPWTNAVDGGGYTLSNTTLTVFNQVDTNNLGTNRITGSIKWTPTAASIVTNVQFGANSYTQAINIQSGTGIYFRVKGGTNFIDCLIRTNDLITAAYVIAATQDCYQAGNPSNYVTETVTNGILAAAEAYAETYTDLATQDLVTAAVTNLCLTNIVAGANISVSQTGQCAYVSSSASESYLAAMTTNYFPVVLTYSGLSIASTNGILWCRNTSGRTWTITNLMWRCAEGTPAGCIATQGMSTAISSWDSVVEEGMVFGTAMSNKAVDITVYSGSAISGFITNEAGTNTEFTLSVHD